MSHIHTVTIDLETFDMMRETTQRYTVENSKLQEQIVELRMLTSGGQLAIDLAKVCRQALKVVQFAQGELHPDTVRGWPHEALKQLALLFLQHLPDASQHEKEWADDALKFARQAAVVEEARRLGIHKQLATVPLSIMETPVGIAKLEGQVRVMSQAAAEAAAKQSETEQQAITQGSSETAKTDAPSEF